MPNYNEFISNLCDWIEEYHAERYLSPGYINDPFDTDLEGWFISF